MLAGSHDTPHGSAVRAHRVAGVVHFVEVDGDLDDVLAVIEVEMNRCQVRALVIDLTDDIGLTDDAVISEHDAMRIIATLDDPRLEGNWHTCEQAGEGSASTLRRLWHDDGREIHIGTG
jgi:hypothetical protein